MDWLTFSFWDLFSVGTFLQLLVKDRCSSWVNGRVRKYIEVRRLKKPLNSEVNPLPPRRCSLDNANGGLWRQGERSAPCIKINRSLVIGSRMMDTSADTTDRFPGDVSFCAWRRMSPRTQRQGHTQLKRSYCGRRALSKHLQHNRSNLAIFLWK